MERTDTGTPPTAIATLDRLLVEAAIQCPEADAITGDFGSMTYADLLIRSQNIALVLKRRGIGPGDFVGILASPSPATITAAAGIILAGAAYVPVHTRLLQSSSSADLVRHGLSLLLWDSASASSRIDLRRAVVPALDLARMEQETMPSSTEIQLPVLTVGTPAARFILETPGPGHATISHRSIAQLVSSGAVTDLRSGDTLLLHAFEMRSNLFALWGSLSHGATLALAPRSDMEPTALTGWILRKGVTVLCLPVARIHEALDRSPKLFASLRSLIIENDGKSGSLSPAHIEWLQRECPRLQIVNVYATEGTAGYATAYRLQPQQRVQGDLPIGLPLNGSRAQIVDDQLEPARPGEMGQLLLSGDCVALLDEQATPPATPGILLTGERARVRADGLLELHGHLEPQLVLNSHTRGFDLADIEAMLAGQKHVREAAVVNGLDRNGKQQLVAYVALDKQDSVDAAPFEETLKGMLPPAAQPSAVRYVEAMPRDAHGDVDRAALQQQWKKESESSQQASSSHQEILQLVRSLWLRLLGRNFVGYEEDFFEAGGTQVQMIRMHSELNRRFPGAISMGQLSVLTTMRKSCEHLLDHLADVRRSNLNRRGA